MPISLPDQSELSELKKKEQMRKKLWTVLGFIVLGCSIMGGSLIGVTSNMLETDASWAKTQWIYALRFLYCLPLAIAEAFFTRSTY